MIGQRIVAEPRYRGAAVVMVLITAGLLASALALGNYHFAIGAILPAALALQIWRAGRADFACSITDEGLLLDSDQELIPFEQIESLSVTGKALQPDDSKFKPGDLHLVYGDEGVIVPGRLNAPVRDLYRFMLDQIPATSKNEANDELSGFVSQQRSTFGDDRVFAYRARHLLRPASSVGWARYLGVGMMVVGVLWIVIPFLSLAFAQERGDSSDSFGWSVVGAIVLFVGFILRFAPSMQQGSKNKIKRWQESGLVISPTGIALSQGDLKGEMRWDELKDIRAFQNAAFGQPITGPGIQLKVAGAMIVVADIYDRPLPVIERVIRRYWRPA